jgi:hypothetical protein
LFDLDCRRGPKLNPGTPLRLSPGDALLHQMASVLLKMKLNFFLEFRSRFGAV